jgi:predicted nucleotidyltransferase
MDGLNGWRDKSESILREISPAMPTMGRWPFAFTRASSTIIHRDLPEWRRKSKFLRGINLCRSPALRDKEVDILRSTFRHFSFVQEVRVFGSRANGIARRSSDLDPAISSPEATPAEWTELQICQELLTDPFRLSGFYPDGNPPGKHHGK